MPCSLAYKPYKLAFRQPLRTAHGVWTDREGVWVRVEDETGRVGFGEVAPLPWFGTETVAEALNILKALGDRLDANDLNKISLSHGCVRFALSCALAHAESPPADVPPKAVAGLLPAGRAALEKISALLEDGWLAFKWKVGVGDPADELAILDDLFGRLPQYARLRLDANGGWTTRQAARWLERCAERPVEFIEQPVAPNQVDALIGLAADYPVTLALDESIAGLESLHAWIGRGWRGVYVIKPSLAGVPSELMATLVTAKADVVFSTALETPIGMSAALQLAFHYQNATPRALGFGVGPLFVDHRFNAFAPCPLIGSSAFKAVNLEALWDSL